MELTPSLKNAYTEEHLSAREAQRLAEFIAWSPAVFQASRLMLKFGILDLLRDSNNGLTVEEISVKTGLSQYAVKVLVEASLSIGIVLIDEKSNRYTLSKTGWFLINDPATRANIDFNHDVCYEGFFRLEESLKNGKPEGLKHFGDWATIYEGLSLLPEQVQRSWFGFDHFYSDSSFSEALKIVFDKKPQTLLDIGGNTGRWAMKCVDYDDNVNVTIVDLLQQIALMKKQTSGTMGAGRIHGYGMNLLDADAPLPNNEKWDAIWMSQFLDCFSDSEVVSILTRTAKVMTADSKLYIMEPVWDRQRFEPAAMCLTLTSLYFTVMANGNSKMFNTADLEADIERAGLQVERVYDNVGQCHSIFQCVIKNKNKNNGQKNN